MCICLAFHAQLRQACAGDVCSSSAMQSASCDACDAECRFMLLGLAGGAEVVTRAMYARRVHELNALSGWRSRVSTLLELGDAVAPLIAGIADRLSRVISWLLVALIGRGLGLIYKGIRQSISGRSRAGALERKDESSPRQGDTEESDSMFFGFDLDIK